MIPVEFAVPAAVAAFALLAWVLLRLCRLTHRGQDAEAARMARVWTALWMVGLLLVTFGGRPRDSSGGAFFNWVPFATQTAVHQSEIVLNFLLFTPAGLLLPWIMRHATPQRSRRTAVAGAASVSLLIEIVQAFTPLGTAGDITDILLNTGGCMIAVIVSSIIRQQIISNRRSRATAAAAAH